jgi:hypothetical protein
MGTSYVSFGRATFRSPRAEYGFKSWCGSCFWLLFLQVMMVHDTLPAVTASRDSTRTSGLTPRGWYPPARGTSLGYTVSSRRRSVATPFALGVPRSSPRAGGPTTAFRLSAGGPLMRSGFTSGNIPRSSTPLFRPSLCPPLDGPFLSPPHTTSLPSSSTLLYLHHTVRAVCPAPFPFALSPCPLHRFSLSRSRRASPAIKCTFSRGVAHPPVTR